MTDLGVTTIVTPSEMVDVTALLMKEDNIPPKYFALAKSMVEATRLSTQEFSDRALALRDPTATATGDVEILRNIGKTKLGADFMGGLTSSQLKHAKSRLDRFSSAVETPYSLDVIPNELWDAFKFFLEEYRDEFMHNVVMFVGLPAGMFDDTLQEMQLDATSAQLNFTVGKVDEVFPNVSYRPQTMKFPLKFSISDASIVEAFGLEEPPTTFTNLVTALAYDGIGEEDPLTIAQINAQADVVKVDPHLRNVVKSYLLKRMYEILIDVALVDDKVQFDALDSRGAIVEELLALFAEPLGLKPRFLQEFLKKSGSQRKLPDVLRMTNIIQPEKIIVEGIDAWTNPVGSPVQLDVAYNLFSTKPFYSGKIQELMLTRNIFDTTYALMIDVDSFPPTQDSLEKYARNERQAVEMRRATSNRLSIDALYIKASLRAI